MTYSSQVLKQDDLQRIPWTACHSLVLFFENFEPTVLDEPEMLGSEESGADLKYQVLASGFKDHTFWLMAMDHCPGQVGWVPGLLTSR